MKAFRTFDNEKVYVFHIYLHIPYNSWWTTTWNIKQHQQKMTIMRKILFLFCLDYLRLELLVILIKDESGSSFSTKFWFFYARYARYWTQHNIYQLALIILKPSKLTFSLWECSSLNVIGISYELSKVALTFGCAKESKNLKRYLIIMTWRGI